MVDLLRAWSRVISWLTYSKRVWSRDMSHRCLCGLNCSRWVSTAQCDVRFCLRSKLPVRASVGRMTMSSLKIAEAVAEEVRSSCQF